MISYYSTFPSGLSDVIKNALTRQISGAKIDLLLDGLIVYQTERPPQQIKQIRFFNNTFLLLHMFKGIRPDSIPLMMNTIFKKPDLIQVPRSVLKGSSFFRIMASKENQTVPINKEVLGRLESFFSHKLNLRIHRSKPDVEVWFLERSEGIGLVGIRLTHASASEKNLQRGELRPELANILCLISEPKKEDVFLDPFVGSGAIPLERAKMLPSKQIIASDNDKEIVRNLRNKISKCGVKITTGEWDVLNLGAVMDGSITRIVTDPPWGIYSFQDLVSLEHFYSCMLAEFTRILKDNSIVVLLMGQKETFELVLKEAPSMVLLEKYDILVSGKKAAVYKIKKTFMSGTDKDTTHHQISEKIYIQVSGNTPS